MSTFSSFILEKLAVPDMNLIYYIVLAYAVAGALQSGFNQWRTSEYPQARRAMTGLGILLGAQIFMFIVSALGWQGMLDSRAILPPLDRAYLVFGIIWITWLYAFPEPSRISDTAATLLSLLLIPHNAFFDRTFREERQ